MEIVYALLLLIIIALQGVIIFGDLKFSHPYILMHEGKLNYKNMKKCRVGVEDIMGAARLSGYFNLADIDTAVMEKNGKISLLPAAQKRQLCPKDFNFSPIREGMSYIVYQNGNLERECLKNLGLTEQKLTDFLSARGYNQSEISLIIVSESGRVEII